MPTHDPERWINIASQKGFTILDINTVNKKTFTYDDKLQLQCNDCKTIYNPAIGEIIKAKFLKTKCKCQTWKSKTQKSYEDSEDWKVISKINHPMASKYKLHQFQPYYMISRNGEVKNAALEKSCDQPSLSDETYSRVNLKLSETSGYRSIGVHILVACAFVPIPEEKLSITDKLSVDHENKITHDNRAENLRWLTSSEQALNKNSSTPGSLWIQDNFVFFNEDDFREFGNIHQPVEVKTYQNFPQRAKIENNLDYPDEIWKRVEIEQRKYFVSSMGRCYYEHLKAASFGGEKEGYLMFHDHRLHRLIAKAFLHSETDISALDVNHKNGRTYDNRLSNLEWITKSGNALYAIWLGTKAIKASNSGKNPKGTPIRVQQVDRNQNLITIFPSISEASKQTGINERKIKRSIANFENTGTLSFIDGIPYAWIPDTSLLQNFSDKLEQKLDIIESKLDLSAYINDKQIYIGKSDFHRLQQNPDACEAIMKLLEHFNQPILPVIDQHKRKSDLVHLFRKNTRINNNSVTSNLHGRSILNYFMIPIMIKGHHINTPNYIDCWNDKELREQLVIRMLEYDTMMNNGSLLRCYNAKYKGIYNFPPNVAKTLYNHFNSKRVLDFCAGYGGRLLGFWTSKAEEYIGIDPNTEIPYTDLINFLQSETSTSKRVQIINDRAEAVDYTKFGKFDTIFTSPPYFNTEIYSDNPSQSCHMYPHIKDWLEKFLFSTLRKVIEVLLPGGTLMINIKDSKKNQIVEPMLQFLRNDKRLIEGNHIKLIQPKRYKNVQQEYIYVWHLIKPIIVFQEE